MTLGKFKKFTALIALPLAVVACALVTSCSDDDPVLGSFAKTTAAVTTPVVVPSTPITTGNYSGTNINLPAAVANALPTGANITVAPSGTAFATGSETVFDVNAGSTVEVTLSPAGTVLAAPGATLTIPYSPDALVEQGFAANVAGLTPAIVESAVFVTKTSGIGANATTEILTPVPGSATTAAPYTVQIAGLTSFSKFQGIADIRPSHTYDSDTTTTGFQLPAGQFFAAYPGAQLTASGGRGATRKAINAAAEGPQYTFTVKAGSTIPAGLTLSSSGALSGVPTSDTPLTAETKTFIVVVADSAGRTAERTFSVNFAAATIGVITTTALPSGTVGMTYGQQLAVTGPGGTDPANYVWTIDTGLDGSGLSLSATGNVEGSPTGTGTYNFTATATDTTTNVTGQPKALSVIVYDPLEITTQTLGGALVGTPYSGTVAATGGRAPLTFALTQGQLPSGMTLNTTTGVISGTSATDDPQTFTITVTDSDNVAPNTARSVNREFSIIFNAKPDVTATATMSATAGVVDVAFSFTDADGGSSTMGYSASFTYSVGGGAATSIKASALTATGIDLADLATGSNYTVQVDTRFSLEGQRLALTGAETVTFSVTVTDNQFNNNGTGSDTESVNNAVELPPSGTHAIMAPRLVFGLNGTVNIEIEVNKNGATTPNDAFQGEFNVTFDTNVFTIDPTLTGNPPNTNVASVVKLTSANGGTLPASITLRSALGNGNATVTLVMFGFAGDVIESGKIVRIPLMVNTGVTATTTTITVAGTKLSNGVPELIPVAAINGTIILE